MTCDLTLDDSGAVAIGGELVGKLEGFRFDAGRARRRHSWPHLARGGDAGP